MISRVSNTIKTFKVLGTVTKNKMNKYNFQRDKSCSQRSRSLWVTVEYTEGSIVEYKNDWNLLKCSLKSHSASGRRSFGHMRWNWRVLGIYISFMFIDENKENNTAPTSKQQLSYVLEQLCIFWHWAPWVCAGHCENSKFLKKCLLPIVRKLSGPPTQ